MLIFHISDDADWTRALETGSYTTSTRGVTLAEQGFIHASRREQIDDVLGFVYADVTEAQTLLAIDTDRLTCPWQFDVVPGAASSYPHLYGPLNTSAVVATTSVRRGVDGSWHYVVPKPDPGA